MIGGNGNGAPGVKPQPSPMMVMATRVTAEDGSALTMLQFQTITGTFVAFMDDGGLDALMEQIRQQRGGLTIPKLTGLPPAE